MMQSPDGFTKRPLVTPQQQLSYFLQAVRPALVLANAAYSDEWVLPVGTAPVPPEVLAFRKIEIKTPAAFSNTQVYVALVQEWDTKFLNNTGQAGVAIVFAFRGSQPYQLKDWMLDLAYAPKLVPWLLTAGADIKVHAGFLKGFESVSVQPTTGAVDTAVVEILAEYNANRSARASVTLQSLTRLVSVGHSLGGALATLNAAWWRHVRLPQANASVPIICITAGSPRVGNAAFARLFQWWGQDIVSPVLVHRFIHSRDPIPDVPPAAWGFKHVGSPIWLMKELFYWRRLYQVPLPPQAVNRPAYATGVLLDHFQWRYLTALDTALSEPHILNPKDIRPASKVDSLVGSTVFQNGVLGGFLEPILKFLLVASDADKGIYNSRWVSVFLNFALYIPMEVVKAFSIYYATQLD